MTTLTGSQVWAACLQDPKFTKELQSVEMHEAMRPFIEAAPSVLSTLLPRQLSLSSLADAKLAFLRHCIENGLGKTMEVFLPIDGETITDILRSLVGMLESVCADVPAFLASHGVTEEQVMLSPKVGLSVGNKALYEAGELTVEMVLCTQPGVILRNSND